MDIQDIISTDYVEFSSDTPVSKLAGAFDDPEVKGIVVTEAGEFKGVVTRRQLVSSHRNPGEKAGSIVWHTPKVEPKDDVRDVAQLMIDSQSRLLPVFEGRNMVGVVTGDAMLEAVEEFLDAATVADAMSTDLVTVGPDSSFGEALHLLREHAITHLPVVENGSPIGMVSLHDVTGVSTRAITTSQGGQGGGFDAHGGQGSSGGYRSHGGFGAREGELARLLDTPVRDVMTSPARTIGPESGLDDAVGEMFDQHASSLMVVDPEGRIEGIVTKTDVLKALTWGAEGNRAVQIYGTDLLDDISYDEIVSMIDGFDDKDAGMNVLDAKIHLHEHDETLRGTPLLLARIRLGTDRGLYIGTGEGYGAKHAINEAREILERRIRDDKTYGQSKKHPDEAFWERRFGWMLEE